MFKPQQIKHYRSATNARAKTDECDARLIARYIQNCSLHSKGTRRATALAGLRPYKPLWPAQSQLSRLLRRRAQVVKVNTQLRLSLEPEAHELGFKAALQAVFDAQQHLLRLIDRQIEALLAKAEQQELAQRLQTIVGVGTLSGAALLVALERGEFATADAFVAFLGFDPVARDSGQSQGRRYLSKQGDSETRRLLFASALSACQTKVWKPQGVETPRCGNPKVWKPLYEGYVKRGLSKTQALCIVARKIARTAWSLHRHNTTFCPHRLTNLTNTLT